jgi:hypothetical protein
MKTIISGCGILYVAPGDVERSLIKSDAYRAGATSGGCCLDYSEKLHTVTDERGNIVKYISHSGAANFSGRFLEFDSAVISRLLGIELDFASGVPFMHFGSRSAETPDAEIQLLFSHETDSGEMQIYMRGNCSSGLSLTFSNTVSNGIYFEVRAVCGGENGDCAVEFGLV